MIVSESLPSITAEATPAQLKVFRGVLMTEAAWGDVRAAFPMVISLTEEDDKKRAGWFVDACTLIGMGACGHPVYSGEYKDAKHTIDRTIYRACLKLDKMHRDSQKQKGSYLLKGDFSFTVDAGSLADVRLLPGRIHRARKDGRYEDDILRQAESFMLEVLPLANSVHELRTKVISGRKPSENPRKQEENPTQMRGTCQCCFGGYAVMRSGKIAEHGYLRPGDGFLRGRCRGSGHFPFEWSSQATQDFAGDCAKKIQQLNKAISQLPGAVSLSILDWRKRPAVYQIITKDHPEWDRHFADREASLEARKVETVSQRDVLLRAVENWSPGRVNTIEGGFCPPPADLPGLETVAFPLPGQSVFCWRKEVAAEHGNPSPAPLAFEGDCATKSQNSIRPPGRAI